ncbi:MAG: hypothetical protein HY832_01325, partial [Candidatus Aenigmarchaeota archaeon]|nr:hypothetical protein [Candidatus Aenigmarchaeota archaeon]
LAAKQAKNITNLSIASCALTNVTIEKVTISSTNCPFSAHDTFPGSGITYVLCP